MFSPKKLSESRPGLEELDLYPLDWCSVCGERTLRNPSSTWGVKERFHGTSAAGGSRSLEEAGNREGAVSKGGVVHRAGEVGFPLP